MTDRPLVPADPRHVRSALSGVMRRGFMGNRGPTYEQVTDVAAEHMAAELERQGFVIMRKPPALAHSAPPPFHALSVSSENSDA